MCLGNNNENQPFQCGSFSIPFSSNETIFGITFDKKLDFNLPMKTLCKKAAQKINAFNRISYFINQNKRKILVNIFVKSQFNYAPLLWMFCSRNANNMINTIHEKELC